MALREDDIRAEREPRHALDQHAPGSAAEAHLGATAYLLDSAREGAERDLQHVQPSFEAAHHVHAVEACGVEHQVGIAIGRAGWQTKVDCVWDLKHHALRTGRATHRSAAGVGAAAPMRRWG